MRFPLLQRKLSSLRGLASFLFSLCLLVCVLCLAAASAAAFPPQAPSLPQAPQVKDCPCGCLVSGSCTCKDCPSLTATASVPVELQYDLVQVCGANGCRLVKVPRAQSYSTPYQYQGYGQPCQTCGPQASQSYQGGQQGFTRTPFRPIRNLFKRLRGGGCSACGN